MKLEKATIENTKVGDKCYIEVEIKSIDSEIVEDYPIICDLGTFSKNGVRHIQDNKNQLYHISQEEIPTLGEGVEMYVSDDNINWCKARVIAKFKNSYMTINYAFCKYARPIQLTLEQKLENALKEIEELKKQLNGK